MTREEALKVVKDFGICFSNEVSDALEVLIPELADNEEDRIRKDIIALIKFALEDGSAVSPGSHTTKEEALAYLEKQKDEEGYDAIPVESTLEYKLGFKAEKDSEKQKEHDKCPEYCVRSHCIGCPIYEKRKELNALLTE